MALLNRTSAAAAEVFFINTNARRTNRQEMMAKLRDIAENKPELYLAVEPSSLDDETRKLYARFEIIAMKAQAKARAEAMFWKTPPRM